MDHQNDFQKIIQLSKYYFKNGNIGSHPSENEVTSHLVVPLLRAVGWPDTHIGCERLIKNAGLVDICLHNIEDRSNISSISAVIEVKKHSMFCENKHVNAMEQIQKYYDKINQDLVLIVTDGYTYYYWSQAQNERKLDIRYNSYKDFKHALGFEKIISIAKK